MVCSSMLHKDDSGDRLHGMMSLRRPPSGIAGSGKANAIRYI
jgi:hypothetical protein